ncbi:uncharacterized oxidoreductase TM_0325-like isoform X2 [Penaeus monodon]|uniref:uncharacterized oxidoreductase TM_0325-like isoform X2 n=1 Tax=Penaeus monodon TaxID=6687 RepID=UPI0018A71EA6|nr:uncharacterized oxidoreductase TM_0325-like isoform X2 [Penaeus monodon]
MTTPSYPTLAGKVALITGASSGIGRGCAVTLAKEKCQLAITGRNVEALKETAGLCQEAGLAQDKILQVAGDLSNDEDCKRIVDSTISQFGRIDILVNNAGILVPGNLESLSMEEYDRQQNVNTRSMVLLSKLCLPRLIEVKGNIVNISSSLAIKPIPQYFAYNMSKAAIDHMTRSLALEVAGRGVRVNSVNPAVIVTEVLKRTGMSDEDYLKFLEYAKTIHPLGRVGVVEDVSRVVAFLASDHAAFITGTVLPVDGGATLA